MSAISISELTIEDAVVASARSLEVITTESQQKNRIAETELAPWAHEIRISSEEAFGKAEAALVRAKLALKEIDERFDPIIASANRTHKEALSQKNIAASIWMNIVAVVAPKAAAYLREKKAIEEETQRIESQAQVALEMEAHEAEIEHAEACGASPEEVAAIAQRPVVPLPTVRNAPSFKATPSAVGLRENYKGAGENLLAAVQFIARNPQYINVLSFNQVSITQLAKSLRGAVKIPGIRFYNEAGISTRIAPRKGA